ncbi:MAG TPA: biotin synthase BioB [Thermodesulfobium narugense]|uniref:Biotin synthase n=1 Tax=Thermodesulfobium acidiphilum TaxID=1794699 RepID=A0A2R4W2X8_THEAF|nr:biotin synthase BioB [Thermodesulfobium acidiphilum]AWB11022.1 biotin synthase [Thermodesulfobium acidiphilum]PMP85904.1 MAG: biotin synthase BioB [Thermodesulfobium narugense]HEM55142.1 biotin synthase BioB [Thermodesulfobium narugense]
MIDLESFNPENRLNESAVYGLLNLDTDRLLMIAKRIKDKYSSSFELCSIISYKTGRCTENCSFCAQSSHFNTGIEFKKVSVEEVIFKAKLMKNYGSKRFSLVSSGRGPSKADMDELLSIFERLKKEVDIELCASLGIIRERDLIRLKDVGVSTYHHNLESSRSFFGNICSTHSYDERIETIEAVKRVGLIPCVGGIVGLGETFEQRVEFAIILKDLGIRSVPFNILIPIKGTPLENVRVLDKSEVLKTLAIFRIILPYATIRLCAGRESVLGKYQKLALNSAANALMIGGYLTRPGEDIERDLELIRSLDPIKI